jgi:hypothetical protein
MVKSICNQKLWDGFQENLAGIVSALSWLKTTRPKKNNIF